MTLLDRAFEAISSAQDKEEQVELLARLLERGDELIKLYNDQPLAFARFEVQAGSLRGLGSHVRKMSATVKRMARAAQEQAKAEARARIGSHDLADLGHPDLMSPAGYEVRITGVWDGDERIAPEPILITGWSHDLESGEQRWELSWMHHGRWNKRSIARDAAGDPRRLQKFAAYGLPIDMGSGMAVVEYLSAFYAENGGMIREHVTTPRMGWLAPGCRAFQYGTEALGSVDAELDADGGLAEVAAGFRVSGEWEDWRSTIAKHLRGRPQVQLGIYAAAVAPLLEILRIDGFVIDWSGATSRGKTTLLRVSTSVWGDPKRVIGTWRTASTAGPLATAAFLCNLPLVLDDTKHARNEQIVASMMYAIAGGKDTTRGQADGGLRSTKTWRTVMLSTGEKAILDFSEDAGARARTLCIRGAPFGGDTDANRKATEALTGMTLRNHGHLGRRLLTHLIDHPDHGALRALHAEHLAAYAATAGGSVSRRLASPVAALHLVAELLHDLGLPGRDQMDDAMEIAWEAAQASGADSDRPIEAARALYTWAASNGSRFHRGVKSSEPPHGWAGVWIDGELGINSTEARRLLGLWGFDVGYCLNEWHRRGWLACNKGRRTKKFRILGGGVVTTICLDLGQVPGLDED